MRRHSIVPLLVLTLVLVLALAAGVAACGSGSTTTTAASTQTTAGTGTTAAPASSDTTAAPASSDTTAATTAAVPLKIGVGVPMTSAMGKQLQQQYEAVIADFNKSGGLVVKGQAYTLEPVVYDEGFTTDSGKAAAERWVNQDKVKFVLSPVGGPAILGEVSVTDPAKVMLFSGAAITPFIGPDNKYSYRGISYASSMVKWDYALGQNPNIKNIVHISVDDFLGHAEGDTLDGIAKGFGLTVTKHIYFADTTTDFSSIAASAVALKPDIIDLTGIAKSGLLGQVCKALTQAGYSGLKIAQEVDPDADVAAGGAAVEGLICVFADTTQLPDVPALAANMKKVYTAAYGDWIPASAKWIDSFYLFVNAVKKADSLDPDEINAALANGLQYDGFMGPYTMIKRPDVGGTRYCDVISQTAVGVVKSGVITLAKLYTPDEGLKAQEKVLGHVGEWQ